MPKKYRDCNFCNINSFTHPHLRIFVVNAMLKRFLKVKSELEQYICERHFDENDFKPHGGTWRLADGAVPVFLPLKNVVEMDHDYIPEANCIVPTKKFDLLRKNYLV